LATDIDYLVDVLQRVQALENFRKNPDFEPVSIAFKRVDNILKDFQNGHFDVNLLSEDAEIRLFSSFDDIKTLVEKGIQEKDFTFALNKLASLRPVVDNFFDHVMVMDKDEKYVSIAYHFLLKFRHSFIKSLISPKLSQHNQRYTDSKMSDESH